MDGNSIVNNLNLPTFTLLIVEDLPANREVYRQCLLDDLSCAYDSNFTPKLLQSAMRSAILQGRGFANDRISQRQLDRSESQLGTSVSDRFFNRSICWQLVILKAISLGSIQLGRKFWALLMPN